MRSHENIRGVGEMLAGVDVERRNAHGGVEHRCMKQERKIFSAREARGFKYNKETRKLKEEHTSIRRYQRFILRLTGACRGNKNIPLHSEAR